MKTVNYGPKYEHRVTVRLTDDQFNFLINVSNILGVSPSDYMRMTVNTGMVAMENDDKMKGLVGTHEDVKTNINDLV